LIVSLNNIVIIKKKKENTFDNLLDVPNRYYLASSKEIFINLEP